MNIILDIILLVIVALSIWYGYKRGLIGSMAGILAIVIAVFGGTLLSSAYSGEVIPALKPFAKLSQLTVVPKTFHCDTVLEKMGYGNTDLSLDDVLASDSSLRYDYAVLCMEELGFHEDRAEELAERAVRYADQNDVSMPDAVITILCDTITYVAGLTICFLLILIILVAISNIGNLVIRLPDSLELLDELGGALMGFVTGFLYCVLLCWLLSFLGLVIGKDTIENTLLARFFLSFRFLTDGLL